MSQCVAMSPLPQAGLSRPVMTVSDPHDRALVRHMLTMTPTERLRNVSAFWPVVRAGLERRHQATGVMRS